jgi:hypothetical protein
MRGRKTEARREEMEGKIDWTDLGQVVDTWEDAKDHLDCLIYDELFEGDREELMSVIQEFVTDNELPNSWVQRLRDIKELEYRDNH